MGLSLKRFGAKSEKKSAAGDWPVAGESVWVRLDCCTTAIHPTVSQGVSAGDLVITAPVQPHVEPIPVPTGETMFTVGWREGTSSKQVKVKVVGSTPGDESTWSVRAMTQAELVQRRNYVRALWSNDVQLFFISQTVKGKIADIGEGGLRCIIPAIEEPRDLTFQVSFTLDTGPILLTAKVAWWAEPVGGTVQVGLKFVEHEQAIRDRIRSHTFALELEERRSKLL